MEIKAPDIQDIILSHGHADHSLGLPGLVQRLGARNLPLVLHPDAYLDRKIVLPYGHEVQVPAPKKVDSQREYIEIAEETGPSMLVDEGILFSGEVARRAEFETGFAIHYADRGGNWEPDPLIMDDQCAIMNFR